VLPSQPYYPLKDVDEAIATYAWVTELGGKGWFHQFPLHPEISRNWTLLVDGTPYRWTRMPMGWSWSVFVAQSVAEAIVRQVAKAHPDVRVITYIDNIYIFGHSHADVQRATATFLVVCERVSATFEVTTPPGTVCDVIGIRVDLERKTASLTERFMTKFHGVLPHLSAIFQNEKVSTRMIWKLFGNLMWGARVLQLPLCQWPRFLHWIRHRARQLHENPSLWERPCHIWPLALRDLQNFCRRVADNTPRAALPDYGVSTAPIEVYTDASDVGYGVIVHTPGGTVVRAGTWLPHLKKIPIQERELIAAALGTLYATVSLGAPRVHLYTDNTNVVTWLRRGHGPTHRVNSVLQSLLRAINDLRSIVVTWVPSAENPADGPSRDPSQSPGLDWKLLFAGAHD
jgi:hypothetical protein